MHGEVETRLRNNGVRREGITLCDLINRGGYLTGFNETEAESSSHWMDDRANYIKLDAVATFFDQILSADDNRMDPQLMADVMVPSAAVPPPRSAACQALDKATAPNQ